MKRLDAAPAGFDEGQGGEHLARASMCSLRHPAQLARRLA